MVALTQDRDTVEREGRDYADPVAANARIFAGSIVALNAAGFAVPGATSATLTVIGRARARADNTGGIDGAIRVETERGVFRFANSAAADLVTRADIGKAAYLVDDQTVAKTNGGGTRSVAGTIVDVDANGVWLRIQR